MLRMHGNKMSAENENKKEGRLIFFERDFVVCLLIQFGTFAHWRLLESLKIFIYISVSV